MWLWTSPRAAQWRHMSRSCGPDWFQIFFSMGVGNARSKSVIFVLYLYDGKVVPNFNPRWREVFSCCCALKSQVKYTKNRKHTYLWIVRCKSIKHCRLVYVAQIFQIFASQLPGILSKKIITTEKTFKQISFITWISNLWQDTMDMSKIVYAVNLRK